MKTSHLAPFSEMCWFVGVIENTDDPFKINRVQVRCIGYHTDDRGAVPTESLPWAGFVHSGARMSAPVALPGDWCVGFFLDGPLALQPVILGMLDGIPAAKDASKGFNDPSGVYPKILNKPTNSPLARNDMSVNNAVSYSKSSITTGVNTANGGNWSEPASSYAARYPENHVIQTDAGNVIELDDTVGAERIQIFHKSGSFTEFHTDGSIVHRALNGRYQIVMQDDNVAVSGDCNISCAGNLNLLAGGDVNIGGKNVIISGNDSLKLGSGGDVGINAQGDALVQGNMVSLKGASVVAIDAASIAISSGESEPAPSVKSPPSVKIGNVGKFGQ